jgi:hypothetical protein
MCVDVIGTVEIGLVRQDGGGYGSRDSSMDGSADGEVGHPVIDQLVIRAILRHFVR